MTRAALYPIVADFHQRVFDTIDTRHEELNPFLGFSGDVFVIFNGQGIKHVDRPAIEAVGIDLLQATREVAVQLEEFNCDPRYQYDYVIQRSGLRVGGSRRSAYELSDVLAITISCLITARPRPAVPDPQQWQSRGHQTFTACRHTCNYLPDYPGVDLTEKCSLQLIFYQPEAPDGSISCAATPVADNRAVSLADTPQ